MGRSVSRAEVWIVLTWIAYEGGWALGACDSEEAATDMVASHMGRETFKKAVPKRVGGEISYTDPKCESFGYSIIKAELNKALE